MSETEYRVLHLEDNQVNALVVRKMLEACENPAFAVSHADCLLKALDLLSQGHFDAALIDLNLPDSSGIETFLAIHRNAPGVAVVVLSGCGSEAIAMKAVELGAQDYLQKPQLNKSELNRALQYAIIRSRKTANGQRIEAAEPGTVIGFIGAKGGVGTTTLACHTAQALARE